jgi:HK97 gp10 family phage protein
MSDSVSFEWDFSEIMNEFEKMGKDIEKVESKATKKAAKVVKVAIEKNVGRSDINKEGYTHMQDDVKISGLKEDEKLDKVREIKGGKKTGYKWKWREFGTSKQKGNAFMTKSVQETQQEVQKIINDEIKKELDL